MSGDFPQSENERINLSVCCSAAALQHRNTEEDISNGVARTNSMEEKKIFFLVHVADLGC